MPAVKKSRTAWVSIVTAGISLCLVVMFDSLVNENYGHALAMLASVSVLTLVLQKQEERNDQ